MRIATTMVGSPAAAYGVLELVKADTRPGAFDG